MAPVQDRRDNAVRMGKGRAMTLGSHSDRGIIVRLVQSLFPYRFCGRLTGHACCLTVVRSGGLFPYWYAECLCGGAGMDSPIGPEALLPAIRAHLAAVRWYEAGLRKGKLRRGGEL